jgi:hypothetical protein
MMSDEASGKSYVLKAEPGRYNLVGHDASMFVTPYPQRLLAVAKSLIDQDQHSVSIVVAHIACEVAVDQAMTDAFKKKGIEYLEDFMGELISGNNLGNEKIQRLYTLLTGARIQDQPFWAAFKESVKRRNAVSHSATIYGKSDAEASLKAARELVDHLEKRSRPEAAG